MFLRFAFDPLRFVSLLLQREIERLDLIWPQKVKPTAFDS
jgi:hypothetical protein